MISDSHVSVFAFDKNLYLYDYSFILDMEILHRAGIEYREDNWCAGIIELNQMSHLLLSLEITFLER